MQTQRDMLRTAFDLGITHFDLANNYGPPYGSAETNFGVHLQRDFKPYRDELIISSKAGWDMWPGPYGQGGGSRKYVLASLDQSLQRMGLDYVDIFTAIASIQTRRWKKPWAPWPARYSRAKPCTWASAATHLARPVKLPRCCAAWASRP